MPKKTLSIVEGRVVKILGSERIVANIGLEKGVVPGDVFAVFEMGEEIIDPQTDESLGHLEKLKGHFVAHHVQPLISQLRPQKKSGKDQSGETRGMTTMMNETGSHRPLRARNRPNTIQVGDQLRLLTSREG